MVTAGGSLNCIGKQCTHRPTADVGYKEVDPANLVARGNETLFPSTVKFDDCPTTTDAGMCRLDP